MHSPAAAATSAPPFDPYEPWRRTLLTAAEVRELSVLKPWRAVADIAMSWLLIVGAWVIAARWDHWLALVLAVIVIGNRYYALFIIGHDGLHRRLMPSRAMNDALADIFVFGPLAQSRESTIRIISGTVSILRQRATLTGTGTAASTSPTSPR